jgi:hypothetical protein
MTRETDDETSETERDLYEPIKDALIAYLRQPDDHITLNLEVTAYSFSQLMQHYLSDELLNLTRNREFRPDLFGHIGPDCEPRYGMSTFTLVVEVKPSAPTLKDVFQAKRYGELYLAQVALLVSTELPEVQVQRLLEKRIDLRGYSGRWLLYLCHYNKTQHAIDWWFDNSEPRRKNP